MILIGIWAVQKLIGMIGQEYFADPFLNSDSASYYPWLGWLLFIIGIGTLMIAVGAAGRIAALIILFGVGMYVNSFGLNVTEALLVVGAAAILYIGTGPYSIWNPERGILTRRLGEL